MPSTNDLPWVEEDEPDGLTLNDVVLMAGAPIIAGLIWWRRSYLLYLSVMYGGWTELYVAVPIVAAVSAVLVAVWAWRHGGEHPVAFPALMACAGTLIAGIVAWEVTMH